jgi:hypothetical protein
LGNLRSRRGVDLSTDHWEGNMPEVYDSDKTTTEVRQANRRTTNFRVLIISTILIVIAFAVIYFIFNMQPTTVTTAPGA